MNDWSPDAAEYHSFKSDDEVCLSEDCDLSLA